MTFLLQTEKNFLLQWYQLKARDNWCGLFVAQMPSYSLSYYYLSILFKCHISAWTTRFVINPKSSKKIMYISISCMSDHIANLVRIFAPESKLFKKHHIPPLHLNAWATILCMSVKCLRGERVTSTSLSLKSQLKQYALLLEHSLTWR